MANLPESGVKLVIETAEAQSAVDELTSALDALQGTTYTAEFTVEADGSAAQEAIDDLPLEGGNVDFTVDATLTGDDLPVDGETVDETVNTNVQPANEDSKKVVSLLESINAKETFRMVVDIAGTALDFLKAFEQFSVEPLLDVDDAVAKITAQTGEAIPGIKEIVSGIRYDDLGDSFEQIADIVIKAKQMGAPFEEATRSALTFTHTFTDQNPLEVLDAMNAMVTNKLVPNYTEASDLLTVAFQKNGNRGGDLLNTIQKNATAFHDLGFTGKDALGNIVDGLNKGFTSADQVANAFTKIKQNVQNAAGNETSDVTKQLEKLGVPNPAESGKAWGTDFVAAVIKGIQAAPVSDAEKEKMLGDILGDKFTGKAFSALMQMSPEEAADVFVNTKGAADKAAKDMDDSFRGAIDDFMLAAEQKVTEWLSSAAIDLPGKIKLLKDGLQAGMDELAKGGTLSEALTVALKPIGFDDEFRGLEAALGNFVIGILQAVESIQRALPGGGAAADQTAFTIHQLARKQLAFDLQIANPDDIAATIKTATERGLDPAQIAGSIGTAVDELVKSGAPEAAQAIIDAAKTSVGTITFDVQGELSRKVLESQGQNPTFSVPVTPEMTPEDVQKTIDDTNALFLAKGFFLDAVVTPSIDQKTMNDLQKKVDDAFVQLNPTMEEAQKKITDTSKPLVDMANSTTAVSTNATNAKPNLDGLAAGVSKTGGAAKSAAPAVADTAVSIDDVGLSAMAATVQMNSFGNEIDIVAGKLGSALGAADAVNAKAASDTNTPTSGPHAAGGSFLGTGLVGEQGREIVSSNTGLAVLNNMTTERILAALQAFVPGGNMTGRGGGNTNIINNVNNVPNVATADALGYAQAATLRGMNGG